MAIKEDKVVSSVVIDGKQAINELGKFEQQANEAAQKMKLLQKEVNQYTRLNERMKVMEQAGKTHYKEYKKATEQVKMLKNVTLQYTQTQERFKGYQTEIEKLRKKLGLTGLTMRQLKRFQRDLNAELNNTVRGTQRYEELRTKLGEVNGVINKQRAEIKAATKASFSFSKSLKNIGEVFAGSILSEIGFRFFEQFTSFFQNAVQGASKISDEMANIRKTTNLSEEAVKKLNSQMSKLDTRTSGSDLREIARVGGQMGVATDELFGFVEAVDKITVALGDDFGAGAEEVAAHMGKLNKIFSDDTGAFSTGEAMEKIGSAMNHLASKSSAVAPLMTNFAKRLGAIGDLGPNLTETLGLGAALTGDLGLTAQVAAGGLTRLFITAGEQSAAFARQLGMTESAFKALLNESPNEMLLKLAESMKGFSTTQIIETLNGLKIGTQESIKVIGLLSNNVDFVRQQQKLANDAFIEATSIQNEYNIKNENTAAQLAKVNKRLARITMSIGQAFVPYLIKALELTVGFLETMRQLPKWIKENETTLMLLGAAIIQLNLSTIASTASTLANTVATKGQIAMEKLAVLWKNRSVIAQRVLNATMLANPIGIVVAAISGLVIGLKYLYENSEQARRIMDALWNTMKELGKIAMEFFRAFGEGFSDIMDGNIKDGFKKLAGAVAKNNPHTFFFSHGKRLGKAWTDGFNEETKRQLAEKKVFETAQDEYQKSIQAKRQGKALATQTGTADGTFRASGPSARDKIKSFDHLNDYNFAKSIREDEKGYHDAIFNKPAEDPAIQYAMEIAELEEEIWMQQDALDAELEDKKRERAEETLRLKKQQLEDEINLSHAYIQAGMDLVGEGTTAYKFLAHADALMNTYKAANQALAMPPGPPATIPLAGMAIAAGLRNVMSISQVSPQKRQISKPKPSFFFGGDTGNVSIGSADNYGAHTGYVHANEYVVPEFLRSLPQVASMTGAIENLRTSTAPTRGTSAAQGIQNQLVNFDPISKKLDVLIGVMAKEKDRPVTFEWKHLEHLKDGMDELNVYTNEADL